MRLGAILAATTSALVLAVLAVSAVATASTARAEAAQAPSAAPSCGEIRAEHDFWAVTIQRGSPGCATARVVLRSFIGGAGVQHGGPYEYEKWWTLGRWRCAHGAGSASCIRGGTNYRTARDDISAAIVTEECGHEPPGASEPPACKKG